MALIVAIVQVYSTAPVNWAEEHFVWISMMNMYVYRDLVHLLHFDLNNAKALLYKQISRVSKNSWKCKSFKFRRANELLYGGLLNKSLVIVLIWFSLVGVYFLNGISILINYSMLKYDSFANVW